MSLAPVFKIGLWNAWIFMIWLLIQNFGMRLVSKEVYQKAGQPPDMKPSQTYKIISYVSMVSWFLATAYSIFLPFKLGTIWFAVGLTIFLLGLIVNTVATINFVTTPMNEPVTSGVHRYSRHPIYIAILMIYLSVSIASVSWIFLLFTVLLVVEVDFSAIDEERYCLEKYGDAYRNYMSKTPRWIGIPRSG